MDLQTDKHSTGARGSCSVRNQRGFAYMLVVYAIAALAVVSLITWGVMAYNESLREQGRAEIQAKWDKAVVEQQKKEAAQIDSATKSQEAQREKARTVYRTITRNVDRVVARDVYVHRCFDDDGMQYVNAALAGPNATPGKPDSRLPGPDAARGRDGRGGAP